MGTKAGAAWIIAVMLVAVGLISYFKSYDATDSNGGSRSGMRLFTDYETGVQYVGGPWGGITPRLRADGTLYTVIPEKR